MLLVVFRSSPESAAFPLTNPECLSSFGVQSATPCSNVLVVAFESSRPVPLGRHRLSPNAPPRTLHTGVGSRSARPNPKPGPVPSSLNLYARMACPWATMSCGHVSSSIRLSFSSIYLLGSLRYSTTRCRSRVRACSSPFSHVNNRIHIVYQ